MTEHAGNPMLFLTAPDSKLARREPEPAVTVTMNGFPPDVVDDVLADFILGNDEEQAKNARELWRARHKHEKRFETYKLRVAHGHAWGDI